MRVVVLCRVAALVVILVACRKESVLTTDAGAKISPVPAPNSLLAQELGADDAGRGNFNWYVDGPGCGPSPRLDLDAGLGTESSRRKFFAVRGSPPKGPDDDKLSPIQLEIRAPSSIAAGASFTVQNTLTNRGRGRFVYERAVEGSDSHWASPFVDVYLRAEPSRTVYRWAPRSCERECGNIGTPDENDFVTLKAGEKRENPFGEQANSTFELTLSTPGTYTLWVVYASCQGPEMGMRGGPPAAIPDGIFWGNMASNGVTITVNAAR